MDRLVHQHTATGVAPFLAPAGSLEIALRTKPIRGDQRRSKDRADGSVVDQRTDVRVRRLEPVLEPDLHDEAGGAGLLTERVSLRGVGDERLLAIHVQSRRERVAHEWPVGAGRCRQDHGVDEPARVQLGGIREPGNLEPRRGLLANLLDHVADRGELVLGHRRRREAMRSAHAGDADNRDPHRIHYAPQLIGSRAGYVASTIVHGNSDAGSVNWSGSGRLSTELTASCTTMRANAAPRQ